MINELLTVFTFFIPILIIMFFFRRASYAFFALYRKKKNPKYPILPQETPEYLSKDPVHFFKVLPITPFFMWKILFEKHKDKELNDAAKKVRFLVFLFIIYIILQFILPILTAPNLNFRLP